MIIAGLGSSNNLKDLEARMEWKMAVDDDRLAAACLNARW
jgi:hypothetical protein